MCRWQCLGRVGAALGVAKCELHLILQTLRYALVNRFTSAMQNCSARDAYLIEACISAQVKKLVCVTRFAGGV
jgi:hypothetical protein